MKRLIATIAALMLALMPAAALGDNTFDGKVVAGEAISVTAPFGGTVASLSIRAGTQLSVGEPIAEIETGKVYATADGTVTGVFAQAGDGVENVVSRYGAVMYILPDNKYVITADIEKAYNSSDMKYVNIGETVYLRCVSDGDHTATGVITSASGTNYTVETTSGELIMEESVNIYRTPDYATKSRIGRGTVSRNPGLAMGGSGSILRLHVKDGDAVKRGELLYETVTGSLNGLYATDNVILSDVNGVIASVGVTAGGNVTKGDTLLTVYPRESLQIETTIDEYDLATIAEGDKVSISFSWDESNATKMEGVVSMISHISESSATGEAAYKAYIDFTPTDEVRLGMTVVVNTVDKADDTPDAGNAD